MTEEVQVEQVDRDAAADWRDARHGYRCSGIIRNGGNDGDTLVQAFARHRLATIQRQDERVRDDG